MGSTPPPSGTTDTLRNEQMNPTSIGRDRGGNPFSVSNALKPSKAPVTLKIVSVDGRLSYTESEALRAENAAYQAELLRIEDLLKASQRRMEAMAQRLADIALGRATPV